LRLFRCIFPVVERAVADGHDVVEGFAGLARTAERIINKSARFNPVVWKGRDKGLHCVQGMTKPGGKGGQVFPG